MWTIGSTLFCLDWFQYKCVEGSLANYDPSIIMAYSFECDECHWDFCVQDLIDQDHYWNQTLLESLFPAKMINQIQYMPLACGSWSYQLCWGHNRLSQIFIKDIYQLVMPDEPIDSSYLEGQCSRKGQDFIVKTFMEQAANRTLEQKGYC